MAIQPQLATPIQQRPQSLRNDDERCSDYSSIAQRVVEKNVRAMLVPVKGLYGNHTRRIPRSIWPLATCQLAPAPKRVAATSTPMVM